jgi:hypothetical protein
MISMPAIVAESQVLLKQMAAEFTIIVFGGMRYI